MKKRSGQQAKLNGIIYKYYLILLLQKEREYSVMIVYYFFFQNFRDLFSYILGWVLQEQLTGATLPTVYQRDYECKLLLDLLVQAHWEWHVVQLLLVFFKEISRYHPLHLMRTLCLVGPWLLHGSFFLYGCAFVSKSLFHSCHQKLIRVCQLNFSFSLFSIFHQWLFFFFFMLHGFPIT